MGELIYKHQNNWLPDIYDFYFRTSERSTDIVHVQDQTKICLHLGQELVMAISVLHLPQPINGIKYL